MEKNLESARDLLTKFESIDIAHIDRSDYTFVDALSRPAFEGVFSEGVSFIHPLSMHDITN